MMEVKRGNQLAAELDNMAVLEDDPVIEASLRQMAAQLRVLGRRYERKVHDKDEFMDKRLEQEIY
jgi:hypothetical protein